MDEILLEGSLTELADRFGNITSNILYPESEKEVAMMVKEANKVGKKLAIVSGGTKLGYGGIKPEYDFTLSLKKLTGIVEHTPGDMTVTVKPGTTMQTLQQYLKQYNQMVPLDPAYASASTIGGVVSANESGPKRLKYGAARDHVIGMRIVYPDGKIIRTGGKVVKNVAGYDMNKLFIGAMGTLGVITEITLKLRPLPKYSSIVTLSVQEDALHDLKAFIIQLQDSTIEPVSLELVNPMLSKNLFHKEEYHLIIALEDVKKAVLFQEAWIDENKPTKAMMNVLKHSEDFWTTFNELTPNSQNDFHDTTSGVMKVGTTNMGVFPLLQECDRLNLESNVQILAHAGAGHGLSTIIFSGLPENVVQSIRHIQTFSEESGGYGIVKHLPFELRKHLNTWGQQKDSFYLMKGIKQKIDPKNTLNEKRFIGGI
ncbi:FAD-binding oxidoreductase [Pseudalkalibacillus hwajinpoensis]|uniref:FAD-binding oxidoreductase n=1 Tax=Guptibacillus hwajinpoensis TaxID=208199 RepID=UPI001CFD8E8D|nr:FAD-binding oxidoreductase [Pseudalkalibacillus hwajinpoensis]